MKTLFRSLVIALGLITFAASSAWAEGLTIPNTFSGGTKAVADQVNENFTAVARSITRRDGVQETTWSPSVAITSTDFVEIESITINDTGPFDVSLTAHLVVKISGGDSGRYEFAIKKDSTGGTTVGRGWWRPGTASGDQAVTISFTGFEASVDGPVMYLLCGKKYDSGAADATVGMRGLNVQRSNL